MSWKRVSGMHQLVDFDEVDPRHSLSRLLIARHKKENLKLIRKSAGVWYDRIDAIIDWHSTATK